MKEKRIYTDKRSRTFLWIRRGILLLVILAVLIGSGFVYEGVATWSNKKNYPMPGELVDAGGYRLHVQTVGNQPVTIVLEAGSGETSLSWGGIPNELSEDFTVVSYDRGGYGWSERANSKRSGENIVKELHHALQEAGLPGPYLLVGHSLGGMYTRLFAETYSDEVIGLVLVDARQEDDEKRTAPIYAKEKFQSKPSADVLALLKSSGVLRFFQNVLLEGMIEKEERGRFINVTASPAYFHAVEEEGENSTALEDILRGQDLGNLPVRVIARGLAPDYAAAGITDKAAAQIEQIWREGQEELLSISSNSKLVIAKQSGHMVMKDQPELIEEVIRELIDNIKSIDNKVDESKITESQVSESKVTENKAADDIPQMEEVDYSDSFNGVEGSAVFLSKETGIYSVYNKELSEMRSSPCSSFKIISALMGLESGVVTSMNSKLGYDGTVYLRDEWNGDLSLKEAFQTSCVWYFRKLINGIGQDKVQDYLKKLNYGNCDSSEWEGNRNNSKAELNGFWLESSLIISPREQVEVLAEIFGGRTEFSLKNTELVKKIMFIQETEKAAVYGKTGSGYSDNGWFVGILDNREQEYYFAIHLTDKSQAVSGAKAILVL
jgi:beta-lactamase class D/pimeloyl-ACP methyl ester carboxylesterase